ncbi:MAG: nucleotidyltransferase family protein, partial [Tidjanibacter sp.]|nr:nucleotidyltransferase family protein [Tidjanibacter sp.]
ASTNASAQEAMSAMTPAQWEKLLQVAVSHNVVAVVYEALGRLPAEQQPPRQVMLKFAVMADRSIQRFRQRSAVIGELLDLYNEAGIPTMIIKGISVARLYPNPELRTFSDVDTYHFGQNREADALAAERLGVTPDDDVHHHSKWVYKGVLVENHYDFVNTKSHLSNRDYEQLLKAEAEKAIESEWQGRKVMFASPRFNALFLMRHMAAHYAAERVSLRHLLDWKVFVEQCGSEVDWAEVYAIYDKFKMRPFVDAVRGILVDYLGLDANKLPRPVQEDKALEERIVNDILYSEFSVKCPKKGAVAIVWWKIRRFWANRWKHRLVYRESWLHSFLQMTYSHLLKPKTIANVR